MLKVGLEGKSTAMVASGNTAADYGSGSVSVFATPALVALMENAAINALDGLLPEGQTTVGTKIEVSHLAATPKGMVVTAHAKLVEIDRRRLLFEVWAEDEKEKVGSGMHERFIIDLEKFLVKVAEKK